MLRIPATAFAVSLAFSLPSLASAAESEGVVRIQESVVYFDADTPNLNAEGREALADLAEWLSASPDRGVVLGEAVMSETGSTTDRQLSQQRARLARDYLIGQGVREDQITIVTVGEAAQPQYTEIRRLSFADSGDQAGATAQIQPMGGTDEMDMATDDQLQGDLDEVDMAQAEQEGIGFQISAGAGATGFVNSEARDVADVGQIWEARLALGTNSLVSGEVAYVGTHYNMDIPGGEGQSLVGNGAEGNVRVNFVRRFPVQPYLFAGFGWTYLNSVGGPIAGVVQDDNVFYIPAGVGLGYRIGDFLVDLRGTFRPTFDDEAFDVSTTGDSPDLHNWSATARIGWEID